MDSKLGWYLLRWKIKEKWIFRCYMNAYDFDYLLGIYWVFQGGKNQKTGNDLFIHTCGSSICVKFAVTQSERGTLILSKIQIASRVGLRMDRRVRGRPLQNQPLLLLRWQGFHWYSCERWPLRSKTKPHHDSPSQSFSGRYNTLDTGLDSLYLAGSTWLGKKVN